MAKKGKKKEEEKKVGTDFGMNLGGLLGGLGNLIDSVSKLAEKGKAGGFEKQGEIQGLGDKVKGVYGFTVRTLGGEQKVEPFGNIKKTPKGPVVEPEREAIVDVFDEKDHILVVAEIPGVDEGDIKTEIKDDILNLTAEKGDKKYKKEVLLPGKVEVEPISSTYKNGILEIKLKKQGK